LDLSLAVVVKSKVWAMKVGIGVLGPFFEVLLWGSEFGCLIWEILIFQS
jgi:hypothetical protein